MSIDPRLLVGAGCAPVEIEIGPGRGGFLFERLAAAVPELRMVGFEIRRKWATIVDERLRSRRTAWVIERGCLQKTRNRLCRASPRAVRLAVFVHFPDPWWKKGPPEAPGRQRPSC